MLSFLKKFYHYLVSVFFYWCYGRPAKKMIVIGVTGTKGKSTTCRFIASVLEQTGNKVGLMSTVEFQDGNNRYLNDKKMTMLGRGEIHKMMAQMLKNGCKYAVIETSSEGILQFRHFGLHYDICVFTNLGTEHQERHGGFENLRRDKGKIFAGLNKDKRKIIDGKKMEKIIIANTDDENAEYFLRFEADKKIAFGQRDQYLVEKENSLNARILKVEGQKTEFEVNNFLFNLNLAGVFNIYNALPAIAIGKIFLLPLEKIATGIAVVKKVEGIRAVEVEDPDCVGGICHVPVRYNLMQVPDRRCLPAVRERGTGRNLGGIVGKVAVGAKVYRCTG